MSVFSGDGSDGEYSVIGDKGEIGFIDYEEDRSVLCYDPTEEGPVKISVPFPFIHGKPQSILVGEKSKFSITLENTTGDPVELWKVKIFCSNPPDSFTLSLREPPSENSGNTKGFMEGYALDDRVLQAHQTLTIWLSCKPEELGLHTTVVHFDVGDDRIERVVFLLAEDKVSQSLASNKPYRRAPRKRNQFAVDDYVVSTRPASKGNQRYFKNRLPKYPIPNDIRELVENKHVPDVLTEDLVRKNYVAYFSTLLIMEELHLEEEMKAYNMEGVTMKRKGAQFVVLEVPGLAERRPSLVHGDFVYAKLASDDPTNGSVYQGYIYRVEADEVLLRFAIQFHTNHSNDKLYNVQFSFNRVNMRRLYQAVEAAEHLEDDILFPSQSMNQRLMNTSPFVPVTCTLNEEQMHSVEMILGCKGGPPYVIYGPPGTGKTMTLVETILQIYKTRRNGRILICAASNSAADHILERLICNEAAEVKESEIFRLNAASRSYDDVPPDFIRFCYFEESIFKCPPLNALRRYRIVISTYMSSFLLHAEGLRSGHFSHIFLDEAGQASEPETMVPLSILCQPETVVVLAGDPKQLGPVVYSRSAENFGLGKSYLQRLFESEFYESEDDAFVTKLVRNYRCHPAILDLPSRLFYGGDLIACKEDNSSSIISKVDFFPNKEFPVLFVGIQGCDEREGNNPSWFNRIEASKVVDIINKLTSNADLSEADIGVITPYRQQVLKIKNVLETWGLPDVKVGSVEQFQGQEREVIIVSTVRSTVKHNEFDRTYCLGFLSNPKRFNVAITRAKSLLIIVGNPHIVSKDPYWEKLLWHCSDNGSYQGCPLPERQYYEAEEPLSGVDQNNEPDWDSNASKAADWGHSDWGHSTEAEGVPWTPNPGTDATGWED